MAGTRADLYILMGPYIIKGALKLGGRVELCAMDYGMALAARFSDRTIAGSVRWWDATYAAKAFDLAMSPLGVQCITWLTIDRGKQAPFPDDPQAQG